MLSTVREQFELGGLVFIFGGHAANSNPIWTPRKIKLVMQQTHARKDFPRWETNTMTQTWLRHHNGF